jgi:hypothetical protein
MLVGLPCSQVPFSMIWRAVPSLTKVILSPFLIVIDAGMKVIGPRWTRMELLLVVVPPHAVNTIVRTAIRQIGRNTGLLIFIFIPRNHFPSNQEISLCLVCPITLSAHWDLLGGLYEQLLLHGNNTIPMGSHGNEPGTSHRKLQVSSIGPLPKRLKLTLIVSHIHRRHIDI